MKKVMLLAASALATVALIGPAAAQAEVTPWLSEGAPLETTSNVTLSGKVRVDAGSTGGFSCPANANLELGPGSEGNITSLTMSNCSGYGVWATFCSLYELEPINLPWSAYPETVSGKSFVKISNFSLRWTEIGGLNCRERITIKDVLGTVDNPEEISSMEMDSPYTPSGWRISGEFNWNPAGVFGI